MHNGVENRMGRIMGRRRTKGTYLLQSKILTKFCVALSWVLAAPSAHAVDGVAEINHTCAAMTGCFSGDTAGYPVTLDGSAGGSYRLTSNLIVPDENTNGIVVSTSSVGIDLNNFEIVRSGCEGALSNCTPLMGAGSGIRAQLSTMRGVSVKDGSVVGMGFYGVDVGFQSEVRNVIVRWNHLDGIHTSGSSIISGCTAYLNGSAGIVALSGSAVSGNVAHRNGSIGIFAGEGSTVSGNVAYQNRDQGIFAFSGSIVSGNSAYLNGGDGIATELGVNVQGNTARSNSGYGLNLGSQSAYRENVVTDNTAGTVNGGVNMLSNSCNGTTTCP